MALGLSPPFPFLSSHKLANLKRLRLAGRNLLFLNFPHFFQLIADVFERLPGTVVKFKARPLHKEVHLASFAFHFGQDIFYLKLSIRVCRSVNR
jgi:hypothetical protein